MDSSLYFTTTLHSTSQIVKKKRVARGMIHAGDMLPSRKVKIPGYNCQEVLVSHALKAHS